MNKILIIACFIVFLTAGICSAQEFVLTPEQAVKAIMIKAERDSLRIVTEFQQTENDSLKSGIKIRDNLLELKDMEIAIQDSTINRKDQQIQKLEMRGVEIREIKTGFLTWAGVIVSSVAAGMIIGIIIK